MLAQIIASFVCVGIIAAWAVFLVHQDNKKAKRGSKRKPQISTKNCVFL